MKTYSEKLQDPRWQKKRLEVMQRDQFQCQCCGDSENTLNVHHTQYIYGKNVWDYDINTLITFCSDCHERVTQSKKNIKLRIDIDFVHPEYLEELDEILEVMECFNPYDLMTVKKHIIKYNEDRVKKLLKTNGKKI